MFRAGVVFDVRCILYIIYYTYIYYYYIYILLLSYLILYSFIFYTPLPLSFPMFFFPSFPPPLPSTILLLLPNPPPPHSSPSLPSPSPIPFLFSSPHPLPLLLILYLLPIFLSHPLPSFSSLPPLLLFPILLSSSSQYSSYTCRDLHLVIYIPDSSSFNQYSDPACFIGWECRVVQFDKYVFVFEVRFRVLVVFEVLSWCLCLRI